MSRYGFLLYLILWLCFSVPNCATKKQKLQITKVKEIPAGECTQKSSPGDKIAVHYTGYLKTGQVFDSSEQAERDPIQFILGEGRVIKGWEHGLVDMCVGEKRKLVIPPDLAYGEAGYPPAIPPKSTLMFDVTLMGIETTAASGDFFGDVFNLLRILSLPSVLLYTVYHMYKRYKTETETAREIKRKKKR